MGNTKHISTKNLTTSSNTSLRYNSKEWNDRTSGWYQTSFSKMHRYLLLKKVRFFNNVKDKNALILDLGCGNGVFLNNFHKKEFGNLFGIEIDKELISTIPKGIAKLKVGAAEKLPYKNNSFDVVFIYCVLHHLKGIPNYKECMNEINRVLRNGGKLFIMEPGQWNIFRAVEITVSILAFFSKRFNEFSKVLKEEEKEQHLFIKNHRLFKKFFIKKNYNIKVDKIFFYDWVFAAEKPFSERSR